VEGMVKRRRLKITSCEKCQKVARVESRLLGDAAFTVMMPQGLAGCGKTRSGDAGVLPEASNTDL